MEYVGARVYVMDSSSASLIGTVGIITAVSKNCFFLAVDTDNCGTSSDAPQKADKTATTNTAKPTENTATATPTALTLVKATTTIGVVLPSLHSKHKPHTLFTDDAEVAANTSANANSSNTADSSGAGSGISVSGTSSANSYVNVSNAGLNSNTAGENVGFKFDHNEKEAGGRICVLYGKHFMPHCKYD